MIKDLKSIKREDSKALGFTAEPRIDPAKNLENLYHWIVKLYFDGPLGTDLQASQKKFGIDYVELEMRFSEHYPFTPPFVRVVRPRFQFRTGHVTIGGSICMELLTNSGWRSTNDIESILIQIRAEMQGGNARLDLNAGQSYSEHEAWDAFNRAAGAHGWDIKSINPNMFPKV
uniref:UBC core domain-containing protein n=1 Tax=Arcella intermedia TaxID=1963864 RepID=A0A6B2LKV9_9EUKA